MLSGSGARRRLLADIAAGMILIERCVTCREDATYRVVDAGAGP